MSDSGFSDEEYEEERPRKRRRPKSHRKTNREQESSYPEEENNADESKTYRLKNSNQDNQKRERQEHKRQEQEDQKIEQLASTGNRDSVRKLPGKSPVSNTLPVSSASLRRTKNQEYAVAPRYRSSSKKQEQRSNRSEFGKSWRGEWIQIQRMFLRLNEYLKDRYTPIEEDADTAELRTGKSLLKRDHQIKERTPKGYYGSSRKSKKEKRRPIIILPDRLPKFKTEDLAWKVAATTGTIGLAMLLLVNLLPANANQDSDVLIEVIDTKSTLPVSAPKPKDDSIHYEIVLGEAIDLSPVVIITDEPEPKEEIVQIVPDEEDPIKFEPEIIAEEKPDIQLEFLRIPLNAKLAKGLELPEEKVETFVVTAIPELGAGDLADINYGENSSIIENTSAIIINEDPWNEYTAIARTDYSAETIYQGQEIPESKIHSFNHIPEEFKEKETASSSSRTVNIEIEKRYPRQQALGEIQEYSILLKNLSDQEIDEINVTEFIPDGMRVVDVKPAAYFRDNELNWKITKLEPQSVQQILIKVKMEKEGLMESIAYVQPVIAVSSESVIRTFRPKLRLTMLTPKATPVGESFPVRYQVTNLSEQSVQDLVLATDLPDKIDHRRGRKLKYDIGSLESGESREITLKAFASYPGRGIQTAFLNSRYGSSSLVKKNIQVIPATQKKRQAVQPASPVQPASQAQGCCCWKISYHP